MTTAGFAARLEELRQRFARSIPGRVAEIVQSLSRRLAGAADEGDALERQFHSLAGTAGTYGFYAVAAAATDGFDECVARGGECGGNEGRYLWSIIEELADQAGLGEAEAAGEPFGNAVAAGLLSQVAS